MNSIESQSTSEKSSKTLYALVTERGFDFFKVVPDIAQSFGVCSKEEYSRALKAYQSGQDKKTHIAYNLAIKQYLEQGKEIKIGEIDQNILSKFSPNKQKIVNNLFAPGGIYSSSAVYINGLKDKEISALMNMSDENFQAFLLQQVETAKKMGNDMYKQGTGSERSMEQLGNILVLTQFEKEFNQFIEKNPSLKQVPLMSPEALENYYDKLTDEEKKILIELRGTEGDAKKNIKLGIDIQTIYNSQQFKDLPPEQKNTFDTLMVKYCKQNESIGLGEQLKKMWGNIYDKVKNMVVDYVESTTESDIDAIKNDVVKNENVGKYFDDNMVEKLISDENKDYEYYIGLAKLYPTVKGDSKIQEFMNIENPTDQQKKDLMEIIKKKTESADAEGDLMNETRGVVKKQAITSCLDMLQMYMDIDLSEQENVLDQFENVEHEITKDMVLQINGKINGKNLKIYYDLTTGKLQQEEFLSRGTINTPFFINDPVNGKKDIPGIQLPKFDDFITVADPKSMKYNELIKDAEDLPDYKKKVASELKKNVKDTGTRDMDTEKVRFERNIMKNLAAQEIFLFMEQNINESEKSFSSTNNEEVYNMYTLIYNSLELYTLDGLTAFRKNIMTLDTHKDKYMQYIKEKNTNKEKYILGMLGQKDVEHVEDKKNLKKDGDTQNEYTYLKKYADFFAIFKDTTYTLPIIDPIAFTKYTYHVGLEVSQDQAYLTRDNMKRNFNEVVGTEELPDMEKAYT